MFLRLVERRARLDDIVRKTHRAVWFGPELEGRLPTFLDADRDGRFPTVATPARHAYLCDARDRFDPHPGFAADACIWKWIADFQLKRFQNLLLCDAASAVHLDNANWQQLSGLLDAGQGRYKRDPVQHGHQSTPTPWAPESIELSGPDPL